MNNNNIKQVAVFEIGKPARIMTQADAEDYKKARPNVFIDASASAVQSVKNNNPAVRLTQ